MAKRWFAKRAPYHDYRKPGIYFLTLFKEQSCPSLGCVAGDETKEYGEEGFPQCLPSQIGRIVLFHLRDFEAMSSCIKKLQYAIMPDHVHILLEVKQELPEKLDYYVEKFRKATDLEVINKGLLNIRQSVLCAEFNDQLLKKGQLLNDLFFYIRNNPKRLLLRIRRKEFFEREIGKLLGWKVMSYGNRGLLDNPWKESVVVHRKDSEEERNRKEEYWLDFSRRGGVLVGAFIHPYEKIIFEKVLPEGGRIIFLSNRLLADREKPHRELFNACSEGNMLIIMPFAVGEYEKERITRETCLALNRFGERLSNTPLTELRLSK